MKNNKNKNQQIKKRAAISLIGLGLVLVVGLVWANLFEVKVNKDSLILDKLGLVEITPTPLPEPSMEELQRIVLPAEGYQVEIDWGETGEKLVESGAIDRDKYQKTYDQDRWQPMLEYLNKTDKRQVTIDQENAYFWVNTLWALGLVQESQVLEEGIMGTEYKDRIENFASTAGWTLGGKPAVELYSSEQIIELDSQEQERVAQITAGIYRPCCGNPSSFPDCNHGMAILGLVELMVDQGYSDKQIYKAALAFNSYWFPQTYLELAYYFQTEEQTSWDQVEASKVLSARYSSATGYRNIKEQIGNIPGAEIRGGSCGA